MQAWTRFVVPGAALALSTLTATAAPTYRIEAVAKEHHARPDSALGISNNGIVTGSAWMKSRFSDSAFRYKTKGGTTRPLLGPVTNDAAGWRVNDDGAAVGWVGHQAWMWDSAGTAQSLDALMPCDNDNIRSSQGRGINNAGDVVFRFDCNRAGVRFAGSYLYRDGNLIDLGTLGGGDFNEVSAINNAGQIVGSSDMPPDSNGDSYVRAYIWENGSIRDLGTLGGGGSDAEDINDAGHVVGMAFTADKVSRGYWYDGSTMHQLPTCHGRNNWPQPNAINNHGQITGNYYLKGFQAFLYQKGHCYPLQDILDASGAGWSRLQAYDINDDGVIVGTGQLNGKSHAFIATPVKP
jgi:probable HAF family extracellular repeat protein